MTTVNETDAGFVIPLARAVLRGRAPTRGAPTIDRDQAQWLTVTPDALVLRRSAHWLSLTGHDGTENRSSVTVLIPEQNLFNVDNLQMLMEQSREGKIE